MTPEYIASLEKLAEQVRYLQRAWLVLGINSETTAARLNETFICLDEVNEIKENGNRHRNRLDEGT
jgi:prefoldin subunit 5